MKVNGNNETLQKPMLLIDYLENRGFRTGRIAVERNGEIIPKSAYSQTLLSDADTLEIVHFVGGG